MAKVQGSTCPMNDKKCFIVNDVGFCRTSDGKEGFRLHMHLVNSCPDGLESLCLSLRSLKASIEGRPHRISITADSPEFCHRRVPAADDIVSIKESPGDEGKGLTGYSEVTYRIDKKGK